MRKLPIICALGWCLASACSKNIQNQNTNSKAAVNVPATTLFTAAEKNLSDYCTTTSVGVSPFRIFAQGWTETTYTTEARYVLSAYNAPDNFWADLYDGALNNLADAKAAFPLSVH